MGWIAEPVLVAATVEAGGFGFLGAAVMRPDEARAKIAEVRRLTSRPFGVNFHMFQPGADAIPRGDPAQCRAGARGELRAAARMPR